MTGTAPDDRLREDSLRSFASLVESVGVKRFATAIGLSTRQVNRILAGAQPNPVERLILALRSADADARDQAIAWVCQEIGGHYVRREDLDDGAVSAVEECAESIAAIESGQISDLDVREIREAMSALSGLIMSLRTTRAKKPRRPEPPG